MNGRMYDPLVGRFLNADPIISNGGYTQSYNRYSYCLNNPLRFTDPSGYTYKPTYWDEAIGGGGVPVRTYGRFDFAANSVWNNWTGGSNYNYDQNHNRYLDQLGNVVAYQEVHDNYVVPNSSVDRLYTHTSTLAGIYSTGTMIDGFKLNGALYELDHPVPYNQTYVPAGQGANSSQSPWDKVSTTIGVLGLSSDIAKESGYLTTIGTNLKTYSSGWAGSQYVKTIGIAKGASTVFFLAGGATDVYMYSQGYQSGAKTLTNLGVSGTAMYLGGIPGIILGGGYMLIDKTVGWDRMRTPAKNHPGIFYGEEGVPLIR